MTFSDRFKTVPWQPLLVVLTFVTMLVVSWRRWTSMIVDLGRETDLPLRLLSGEVLYRDIHYLYPPISPYLNALLYRIFGVHLDTLAFSGIIFTAVLVFLCYRIARKMMPATGASIAASLIAVMSLKPAGSLVLSYSFAGLHGAVFALGAVLFLMRYAEQTKRWNLLISGVFIGLAAITKQEFGFAAALTATLYPVYLHRSDLWAIVRDIVVAAAPSMTITIAIFGWLFATVDWRILIEDCHLFYTHIPHSLEYYNRMRSGLNDPLGSFVQMVGAAAISIAIIALITLASDRTGTLRRKLIFWIAASLCVALPIFALYREQWDGSPLRALPILLIVIIAASWIRKKGTQPAYPDDRAGLASPYLLFIVALFSLAIIFRVLLRVPSGGFSGSFYVPPSLVLIVYALVRELPAAVQRWTGDVASYSRAKSVATIFSILVVAATMLSFAVRYQKRFGHGIDTPRGSLIAERGSGPIIEAAIRFIEGHTAPGEVIAVLPEGNDLAFLTARTINLRHQVLIPDFMTEQDQYAAVEALRHSDVRYILITNRPMREFGATAFGTDFYTVMGRYISENFETAAVYGSDEPDPQIGHPKFFIKALRRRGTE